MVRFQIIDSKNYFSTKQIRNIAILVFTGAFLLMGKNGNGILFELEIFRAFKAEIVVGYLALGAYLVLSYWYSRIAKKRGSIEFSEHALTIKKENQLHNFNFEELTKLKIVHRSYVHEDYKKNVLNNYFGDNWLVIEKENEARRYEFKVESQFKNNQLLQLVERLKRQCETFEYEIKP